MSTKFGCVVLGPDSAQTPSATVADNLKGLSQGAPVVQLPGEFRYDDPERAGVELLRMIRSANAARA